MKLNKKNIKLSIYSVILLSLFVSIYIYFNELVNYKSNLQNLVRVNKQHEIKYILQWTSSQTVPFKFMGNGRQGFIDRKCQYTNCFVTENRSLLGDYRKFDVIAFSGPDIAQNEPSFPEYRSPNQKYAFGSIESSYHYPLCLNELDNYFNWTWTYKLDSDVRWGYIVIRDKKKNIIGPKKNMHWLPLEKMKPVSNEFKKSLKTKKIAAAWFVSNCISASGREMITRKLERELSKYKHDIHIYGDCGHYLCPREYEPSCTQRIKQTYYFYLSFENAMSEDYVTEKLLHPLQNNAVPIVYGGANYSRFLPDGVYLDAVKMSVPELARKMNELINDPEQYAEYFKWKNHYSYHKTDADPDTDEYCQFCKIINGNTLVQKKSVRRDFIKWWNVPTICDILNWN